VYTALAGLVLPTAAHAQFTATPFSDPATGERYHIEASGAFWNPPPDIVMRASRWGWPARRSRRDRPGHPATAHQGIPRRAAAGQEAQVPAELHSDGLPGVLTLRRDIVFNGIKYSVNLPVTTELSWNTWHLGYEYDFLYRDRWYAGVVVQAKVTDIQAN
jgi:hypothetical protein